MENTEINDSSKWPKDRRVKSSALNGKLDKLEFFRTPNGSFWDPDEEYFNRNGFDIHGGYYHKDMEYIPGPNWLSYLGCYEDEKEKYENIDLEKMDDNAFYAEEEENPEDDLEFKGDFEGEDFNDEEYQKYLKDGKYDDILKSLDLKNLDINSGKQESIDDILKSLGGNDLVEAKKYKKSKGKKKKNSKKKTKNTDEEWETDSDN